MNALREDPQIEMYINQVIEGNNEAYLDALKNDSAVQRLTNLCVQFSGRRITPLVFSLALQRRIRSDRRKLEEE